MQINAICPELIYENNIEMFDTLYNNASNQYIRCQFLASFIKAEMNPVDAQRALSLTYNKPETVVSNFVVDALNLFVESKTSAFDFLSKEKSQKMNALKAFVKALQCNSEPQYFYQIRKSIEEKARC